MSSIVVSKQKPCISTALYVYNKTYSKEIHPGDSFPKSQRIQSIFQ